MTWGVVGVVAAVTVASRMAGLLLPGEPPAPVGVVLDRLPAPLFGALAVTALLADGGPPDVAVLAAFVAALAVGAVRRSLLWVLLAGLAGFGAAIWLV